ncbi:unnamed protein product [marine sediment metagenome]|uniref:Uncharacterized protein n=1 Tax=marine sediment metagenome TaxID=412755 RepID=X1H3I2_9ZZZZ
MHILINNAGVFNSKRILTEDGYESTFAVDYLSHFLLTKLLLDIIKKSAPSRIINVSSDIHRYFKINLDDLMFEKKYSSQKAYGSAKFAIVLFTYELARRLNGEIFPPKEVREYLGFNKDATILMKVYSNRIIVQKIDSLEDILSIPTNVKISYHAFKNIESEFD